ncbi:hypothetical protein AB0J80_36035 [Actinoplanes sp. NPDC049548]|uniref:hypothetical protein n=1 Tax=Actinoplanes sp. NPDC049548 TaxID=3155152 RepID=UPI0034420FC0
MSDTNSTAPTEQTPDNAPAEPTAEQSEETESPTDATPGESEDELPEWARKRLAKANAEAAKYRTTLRETEAKLKDARTPEELDAAVKSVQEENARLQRELLVSDTARKFDLPDELRDVLKGSTQQELEAHAKVLQKYATPANTPGELSGGLDPSDETDAFDPVKAARAARARRY